VTLLEFWAHHEDLLNANGIGKCRSGVDLAPLVAVLARYQSRVLDDCGALVVSEGTVWYTPKTSRQVNVDADVVDLARWLSGRSSLPMAATTGPADAVAKIRTARFSI